MRVLMQVRPDWRELAGGDLVQLERWTVWLRELGVRVRVSDDARPDLTGIDLVHFHNLSRSYTLWPALHHCQEHETPRVLTPLYWPADEYERLGRPGFSGVISRLLPRGVRDRIKAVARCLQEPAQRAALLHEVVHGNKSPTRRFLAAFHGLIVNSSAERAELRKLLPGSPAIHLAHSGVDAFYWSENERLWTWERQSVLPGQATARPDGDKREASEPADSPRKGVLCVARFDPQKGQHRLIEALAPLGVPLTLVGADNPHYPRYRSFCRQRAGRNVTILPRQNAWKLRALYQQCEVFALGSWYEVSALSGLEAGCCGARVVMTARGGWRDYGGDLAWYADPADLTSIRDTVREALSAPATPELRKRIERHFTWEQSARALLRAYEAVLAGGSGYRRAA